MRQVPHLSNGENEAQKIIFLVKSSKQVCVTPPATLLLVDKTTSWDSPSLRRMKGTHFRLKLHVCPLGEQK